MDPLKFRYDFDYWRKIIPEASRRRLQVNRLGEIAI